MHENYDFKNTFSTEDVMHAVVVTFTDIQNIKKSNRIKIQIMIQTKH